MITALTDPSQLPNQLQDQQTFDANMAYVIDMLPERARQENELAANMGMYAAGGAYAFPFIFDSSTVDGDPGVGKIRLGSTSQNAATVMRMDLQIVGGVDISNVLTDLRAATSSVKGSIRLVKMVDPSKWMIFDVSAVAVPTGYRNLTVSARAASGPNPFMNGDALLVYIDRNGDSGTMPGATELLATIPVPAGVSAVNALNVFDADHDWYFVHFTGVTQSSSSQMGVRLAVAGELSAASVYLGTDPRTNSTTPSDSFTCASGNEAPYPRRSGILQISGVNAAEPKLLMWDGVAISGTTQVAATAARGTFALVRALTGFGVLLTTAGVTFTGGTIRVYGVRKA